MRESSGCDVAGSSLSVVLRHLEEEEGVEEGGHGKGRGMQERNAKKGPAFTTVNLPHPYFGLRTILQMNEQIERVTTTPGSSLPVCPEGRP